MCLLARFTGLAAVGMAAACTGPDSQKADATAAPPAGAPYSQPVPPPKCTPDQAATGDVGDCLLAFWSRPDQDGWGVAPAPGVGDGWSWSGYTYSGSAALTEFEAANIGSNTAPVVNEFSSLASQTIIAAASLSSRNRPRGILASMYSICSGACSMAPGVRATAGVTQFTPMFALASYCGATWMVCLWTWRRAFFRVAHYCAPGSPRTYTCMRDFRGKPPRCVMLPLRDVAGSAERA